MRLVNLASMGVLPVYAIYVSLESTKTLGEKCIARIVQLIHTYPSLLQQLEVNAKNVQ